MWAVLSKAYVSASLEGGNKDWVGFKMPSINEVRADAMENPVAPVVDAADKCWLNIVDVGTVVVESGNTALIP